MCDKNIICMEVSRLFDHLLKKVWNIFFKKFYGRVDILICIGYYLLIIFTWLIFLNRRMLHPSSIIFYYAKKVFSKKVFSNWRTFFPLKVMKYDVISPLQYRNWQIVFYLKIAKKNATKLLLNDVGFWKIWQVIVNEVIEECNFTTTFLLLLLIS